MLDLESCNFDVLLLLKIRFLSTCLQRHHNHKDHLQHLTSGRELIWNKRVAVLLPVQGTESVLTIENTISPCI